MARSVSTLPVVVSVHATGLKDAQKGLIALNSSIRAARSSALALNKSFRKIKDAGLFKELEKFKGLSANFTPLSASFKDLGVSAKSAKKEMNLMNSSFKRLGTTASDAYPKLVPFSFLFDRIARSATKASLSLTHMRTAFRESTAPAKAYATQLKRVQDRPIPTPAPVAPTGIASAGIAGGLAARVSGIGPLVGGFTALQAVRSIKQMSDEVTSLDNRLRVVTKTTKEFAYVKERLITVANENYQSMSDTIRLYARLRLATSQYGYSAEEVTTVVDNLSKAIRVGGAGIIEGRAGIIQLAQALGSGELRGDELRSVLEQLQPVAKILAEGLSDLFGKKINVGDLKTLAAEGKLLARDLFGIILDSGKKFDESLKDVGKTFDQTLTQMKNSVTSFTGEFVKVSGIQKGFSSAFTLLQEKIEGAAKELRIFNAAVFKQNQEIKSFAEENNLSIDEARKKYMALRESVSAPSKGFLLFGPGTFALVKLFGKRVREDVLDEVKKLNLELEKVKTNLKWDENLQGEIALLKERNELLKQGALAVQKRAIETKYPEASESQIKELQEQQRINEMRGRAAQTIQSVIDQKKQEIVQQNLLNHMLKEGTITQEEYNLVRNKEKKTVADRLEAITSTIPKLQEENELLRLSTNERRVAVALLAEEKAIKDTLSDQTRNQITSLINSNIALERQNDLIKQIKGPEEDRIANLKALNALLRQGTISQDEYNKKLAEYDPVLQRQNNIVNSIKQPWIDYQDNIKATQSALEQGMISQEDANAKMLELRSNLGSSVSGEKFDEEFGVFAKGFDSLQSKILSTGDLISNSLSAGIDRAGEAIGEFVKTGSVNFRKFFAEIFLQIGQLLAKQALIQAFSLLLGSLTGGLGTAAGAGLGAATTAAAPAANTIMGGRGGGRGGGGTSGFGGGSGGGGFGGLGGFAGFSGIGLGLFASGLGSGQAFADTGSAKFTQKPAGINIKIVNVVEDDFDPENVENTPEEKLVMNVISKNSNSVRQILSL